MEERYIFVKLQALAWMNIYITLDGCKNNNRYRTYVMDYAIWYHCTTEKNVKKPGRVLVSVKVKSKTKK